jgi:hypothetical protein
MSMPFTDLNAPKYRGPWPPPRGLLPVPPEIKEQVAREQARLQPYFTDAYAKLLLDDWTLAYYYEGTDVACRSTPEGVEVLAVGLDEIGAYLNDTPPEQRCGVTFKQP